MNTLLLGSGGREHAIAWKLKQSPLCKQLFIAPGNTGTAQCGTNLPFAATDFEAIKNCCLQQQIQMVIVGPEDPLVLGVVDFLKAQPGLQHLHIIGPSKAAAQLEGSKAYAKRFMQKHGIPTAAYQEFTCNNYAEGIAYIKQHTLPIVLKADGLAAGKGVVICETHEAALHEFEQFVQQGKFGTAGKKVVIEEFLNGTELSVFVLTDGKNYLLLPEAKDYKRIGKGDTGLNTGGMGAISPVPFANDAFMQKIVEKIIEPTIKGFASEQLDYQGFVFFGLIKVGDEPFVIEYNCRMGDPETEVVMPRIETDLLELLKATAQQQLHNATIHIVAQHAATTVAVSGGYPGSYQKGFEIKGLDQKAPEVLIFHAGTTQKKNSIVTNGGRVVCATALANSLPEALQKSKQAISNISFEGRYYRTDIGYEFVAPLTAEKGT